MTIILLAAAWKETVLPASPRPVESGATPTFTVGVSNSSSASVRDIAEMQESATQIFKKAGIEIAWTQHEGGLGDSDPCSERAGASAQAKIVVSLADVSDERRQAFYRPHRTLLGRAKHDTSSVTVFYNTARAMERNSNPVVTRGQILGLAAAHEMGHLLLATDGHSLFGIVKENYSRQDLVIMGQGRLVFTAEESALLRAAVVVAVAPRCIAASSLPLTLVVYNHAHVSPETLAAAENKVSEIFTHPNIQLIWQDGFAYAAERRAAVDPPPEDPATLVIKLQPESEAARYGVSSACGGLGFESGAIVFVRSFDSTRLACVMAHELGHMLLGPNAHSIVGIMRATLLAEDWEKAAQGTLGFTRSQNKQIRTWIDQRNPR